MSAEASTAVQNTPVLMPKIGQAMSEGTVIEWHVKDGEQVEKEAVLVTIETDKATYDLEAPASGTLHIYTAEGQEVSVGTVMAEIGDAPRQTNVASPAVPRASAPPATPKGPARKRILASPKAKQLAAKNGIDLATLTPSSVDGIISAADVEQALTVGQTRVGAETDIGAGRAVRERRQLTGIRKTSARRVQEAWQTIPHIVQMVDVDATALLAIRAQLRDEAPALTLNDLILHTAACVLATQPDLNASVEDDTLVYHGGVDIGLAVDSPRGLLVPVIRRADKRSVVELVAESQRLIRAARSGKLGLDDMGNASLTVSNLGMYGIRFGTPVINLGEPILIFVGAVEDRPVAVDGQVIIRPMLTLSIAYDHRVADGVAAASFTQSVKQTLEGLGTASKETNPQQPLERRKIRTVSEGDGYAVHVRSQNHPWVLDEPTADGGTDTGPDPVSAFLGALLSCMTISFKAAARRRKVSIERIEGRIQATPTGHVKDITLALDVWSPDPTQQVRALLERAERGCYVSGILKSDLNYRVNVSVHGTK